MFFNLASSDHIYANKAEVSSVYLEEEDSTTVTFLALLNVTEFCF